MELFYRERFEGPHGERKKHRGHPFTSLPGLIEEEFALLKGRRFELTGGALRGIGEVTQLKHLKRLAEIAADRAAWRKLANAVKEAALSRWRRRERTRQRIRDGELGDGADTDSEDDGVVAAQMTPAPRGRRQR
jgi:hypothetical protein